MDQKKRNITGAYPGAGGASQTRKIKNPAGSYPAAPKEALKEEQPAEQKDLRPQKVRAKKLLSKESLLQYRNTLIYYSCILVVSIFLAAYICGVGNEVLGLIRPDKEIIVTLEEGASTGAIAKELKKAGIIEHPTVFQLYSKLKKADGKFEHGEFTVNCKDDYNHIISTLRATSKDKKSLTFTIRPGQTQEELVADLCDSKKYLKREELEKVLQTYDFSDYSFLKKLPQRNYRLEGYLYPGEYEMTKGESALAVVERILDRFEEQVLNEENKKLIKRSKYSLDELITLASILQEEGGKELAKGAQVYYNRLKSDFPYLQSQATIAYILPANHETITKEDLLAKDSYNTYLNEGLTPGPIGNPGKDAIGAVLTPEETEALYFVTDEKGEMYFSESLADHRNDLKKAESPRGTETVV